MRKKEEEQNILVFRFLFGVFIIVSLFLAIDFSQAYSNESIEAKGCLNESLQTTYEMKDTVLIL